MANPVVNLNDLIGSDPSEILSNIDKIEARLKDLAKDLQKSIQVTDNNDTQKINELTEKVKELEKALQQTTKAREQANKVAKKTQDLTDEELEQRERERQANRQRTQEAKQRIRESQAEQGSLEQLRVRLARLTSQYVKLSKEERDTTKAGKELREEIRNLNSEIKNQEKAIGDNRRNVGNYKNDILEAFDTSILGQFTTGVGAITLGIGALSAGVIALADSILTTEKRFTDLRRNVSVLTGETGAVVDEIAVNVASLADVFAQEEREILSVQNTLIKEFGVNAQQAFDALQRGFVNGADAQGDLLTNAKEYSSQIREAGGDLDDLINILIKSEQAGIYSDKGVDAVKEFGLRIREQTPTTKKALEDAFGKKFTNSLFKNINDGTITTLEALEQVSEKLNDTTVPTNKLQTVIADTFGGAGEDAGLKFLQTLTNITNETQNLESATNPLVRAQQRQLAITKQIAFEQNQLSKELEGTNSIFQEIGLNIQKSFFSNLRKVTKSVKTLTKETKVLYQSFTKGNSELFFATTKSILQQIPVVDQLTESFTSLTDAEEDALTQAKLINEVGDVASDIIQDEIFNINNKISALEDENLTQEQRNEIQRELIEQYPQYASFLVDEEGNLRDIAKAREDVNKAIIESAVARATEAKIAQDVQRIITNELEIAKKQQEFARIGDELFGDAKRAQVLLDIQDLVEENREIQNNLENIGKVQTQVATNLKRAFKNINLDVGTDTFQQQLKDSKTDITKLNAEIKKIDLKLADDQITDANKKKLEEQRKGLINQLRALEGVDKELKASYLRLLEVDGDGGDREKKTIANAKRTAKTIADAKKGTEFTLQEEIRKRNNELQEDELRKAIENINIKYDKEEERIKKLEEEQKKLADSGIISPAEYVKRQGEITTLASILIKQREAEIDSVTEKAESERAKKAKARLENEKKEQIRLEQAKLEAVLIENQKEIDAVEDKQEELTKLELDAIQALYDARFELKKKAIEKEAQLQKIGLEEESKQAQTVEQDKNNKIAELEKERVEQTKDFSEKRKDIEEDTLDSIKESLSGVASAIIDAYSKVIQEQIRLAEQQVQNQKDSINVQQELAKAGVENSLKFEREELAKREAEAQKARERAERAEKDKALFSALSSTGNGAEAIAQFAIVEAFSRGFKDGGYTGGGGVNDVAGVTHGQEFVVPAKLTAKAGLRGKDASYFEEQFLKPKSLIEQNNWGRQLNEFSPIVESNHIDLTSITKEIKGLREDIKNTPRQEINIVKTAEGLIELVKTTVKGNTTTNDRYRINMPRV